MSSEHHSFPRHSSSVQVKKGSVNSYQLGTGKSAVPRVFPAGKTLAMTDLPQPTCVTHIRRRPTSTTVLIGGQPTSETRVTHNIHTMGTLQHEKCTDTDYITSHDIQTRSSLAG
jgi:hypothetical protein